MLCTFTLATNTKETLVIRSDDIRRIVDVSGQYVPPGQDLNAPLDQIKSQPQSELTYLIGTDPYSRCVLGTAKENTERLQREELEAMARIQAFQQQFQMPPPQLPIPASMRPRGKVR